MDMVEVGHAQGGDQRGSGRSNAPIVPTSQQQRLRYYFGEADGASGPRRSGHLERTSSLSSARLSGAADFIRNHLPRPVSTDTRDMLARNLAAIVHFQARGPEHLTKECMMTPHPTSPIQRFELRFRSLFNEGHGWTFPCDAQGQVDLDRLSDRARNNYFFAHSVIGREVALPRVITVT